MSAALVVCKWTLIHDDDDDDDDAFVPASLEGTDSSVEKYSSCFQVTICYACHHYLCPLKIPSA